MEDAMMKLAMHGHECRAKSEHKTAGKVLTGHAVDATLLELPQKGLSHVTMAQERHEEQEEETQTKNKNQDKEREITNQTKATDPWHQNTPDTRPDTRQDT